MERRKRTKLAAQRVLKKQQRDAATAPRSYDTHDEYEREVFLTQG
ncbi:hypothetical protein AA0114_g8585 [Alternaria tenuissima]|uniref:Uncharacterized protein n=1 Tax=Alternaria tenuissima TaxID=119927 RepID=A0A4Q4M9Q0_9PLEO|nr:hypothetical protein AA0114_g8585 [Alternaria tenuissima]